MTDVKLTHTPDGGEIEIVNGRTTLDDTIETAAYLSLFGGNEHDDGSKASAHLQWWGNLTEPDSAKHMRSETQHALRTLRATTANLARLRDAIERDLAWMVDDLGAVITVGMGMPARNTVRIALEIQIDGDTSPLNLTAPWLVSE